MQPNLRQSTEPLREPPPDAVGASWTARLLTAFVGRGLLIAALAAAFLTWAGAFGTGAAPLPLRMLYWLSTLAGGTMLALAVNRLVCRRGWFSDRPWLQGALTTAMMAVPCTLLVWASGLALFPRAHLPSLAATFGPVLVISGVMTAINLLAATRPVETHASPPGGAPARFLSRLPPKLRGAELYAVEAQDHYLRLHTSRGTDLILMRLADALAELEGLEGAQTHRSWWVARTAVDDARRGDGRGVLILKSGVEAPVSRRFARALRGEGWF